MEIKKEYEIVSEAFQKNKDERIRDYNKKWVSIESLGEELDSNTDEQLIQNARRVIKQIKIMLEGD